jgi:hypothetical protein
MLFENRSRWNVALLHLYRTLFLLFAPFANRMATSGRLVPSRASFLRRTYMRFLYHNAAWVTRSAFNWE